MGSRNCVFLVLALALALAAVGDVGWVVAYRPPDCSHQIARMQSCLTFVEGKTEMPATNCCKGITWVYDNFPVCLCELISSSGGIASTPGINITNAMLLPSFCNIPTDTSGCPALLTGSSPSSKSPPGKGSPPSQSLATALLPSSVVILICLFLVQLLPKIIFGGACGQHCFIKSGHNSECQSWKIF